jgi:hypothetical protein
MLRGISIRRIRPAAILLAAVVGCGLWAGQIAAAEASAGYHAALDSIDAREMQGVVDYLAQDALEGREAGSRGGWTAGNFIQGWLSKLPLRPAGDSGQVFQPFGQNFRNILVLLEGSDPGLKQQVIVVGAHYDHLGYGTPQNSRGQVGLIHHGADDNASGTTAVLELIQALVRLPEPPRRSVLFVFWDAEEKGLLGSKHWVVHPTIPWERVVLMINLDMVGRLRDQRLTVIGSRSSAGLRKLVSQDNDEGLSLEFPWLMRPDADYYSFLVRNVPVLMLHTGLHEDYHRPSDVASKINAGGMKRIDRLLLALVCDLASRDARPVFRPACREEKQQPPGEPPAQPAPLVEPQTGKPLRLGITWQQDDAEPGVAILTEVAAGSPAALAGLLPGDRVYQISGRDFSTDAEFAELARTLPGPIKLRVERSGKLRTVELYVDAVPLRRAA